MNNYKKTEDDLKLYEAWKERLINLKIEYEDKATEGFGLDYSKDKLCQTYKFSSDCENKAESRIQLKTMIDNLQYRVDKIKRGLDILLEEEGNIIIMCYMRNEPLWKVARENGMSVPTCKRKKAEAMKKLQIAWYGGYTEYVLKTVNE